MKTKSFIFGILVMAFSAGVFAQTYSINWYKIAGGGGTSTNGIYSLSGTIGQPDASTAMTGGNYSLTGGFWSLFAVQTAGSPFLSIFGTTNAALVSWPVSSATFRLQANANLNTTNWTVVTNAVNVVNGSNQVTIFPATGNQYFRLINP